MVSELPYIHRLKSVVLRQWMIKTANRGGFLLQRANNAARKLVFLFVDDFASSDPWHHTAQFFARLLNQVISGLATACGH